MDREEAAKLVFGRPARLDLGTWILKNGPVFSQHDAIEANGGLAANNAVRQELEKLQQLGMVEPAPTEDRKKYYSMLEHPFWEIYRAADEAFARWGEASAREGAKKRP